jgi:hypothetical protein
MNLEKWIYDVPAIPNSKFSEAENLDFSLKLSSVEDA